MNPHSCDRVPGRGTGFSLVELVIVIVLLAITGAVLMSTLASPSSFDALGARDALISVARSSQQHALGRTGVTFAIEKDGDWIISAKADDGFGAEELQRIAVPSGSIALETGGTGATAETCATGFDTAVATDFSVAFDGVGNATTLTNGGIVENVANGIRICINDNDRMSVCISPAGFAHEGICEE